MLQVPKYKYLSWSFKNINDYIKVPLPILLENETLEYNNCIKLNSISGKKFKSESLLALKKVNDKDYINFAIKRCWEIIYPLTKNENIMLYHAQNNTVVFYTKLEFDLDDFYNFHLIWEFKGKSFIVDSKHSIVNTIKELNLKEDLDLGYLDLIFSSKLFRYYYLNPNLYKINQKFLIDSLNKFFKSGDLSFLKEIDNVSY